MANAELTGVQKAAVLLITLGPEKSASIFKHLKEEEIEELTLEIANTRSISPQEKEDVLNEFYQVCLAQQYIAEGGIGYAKELLEKALGEQKAQDVITKYREPDHCQQAAGVLPSGRHCSGCGSVRGHPAGLHFGL